LQKINDDISYSGQKLVQAGLGRILTESLFEDSAKEIRDRTQILSVDADGIEGAAGNVELVTQTDVDVGDLALRGISSRPLCQSFEELLGRDEEVGDALFNLRELLLGLK